MSELGGIQFHHCSIPVTPRVTTLGFKIITIVNTMVYPNYPVMAPSIKIHILQAKLDVDTITKLYSLIDNAGPLPLELSADPSAADVIVTNIRMRKRFERHLHWNIAVGRMTDLHSSIRRLSSS